MEPRTFYSRLSEANCVTIEDWEGVFDNFILGLVGASYGTVSGSMVVSNAAGLAGAAATAAAAGVSITAAGFAMYGLLGIWSGYGLAINHTFRSQLESRLKGGEDLHATLSWLGSLVRGTWSKGALEKKWDQFASRTSEAACRLVREKVTGEFLKRLEAGDPEAIAEAKFIVKEVERANAKQLVKNYLLMAIAFLELPRSFAGSSWPQVRPRLSLSLSAPSFGSGSIRAKSMKNWATCSLANRKSPRRISLLWYDRKNGRKDRRFPRLPPL